ncbi:hypothetical protein O9H85_34590 [Paenibacillus filicis]|uniref:Uncharacterized protein n=1 Tax=Paenibacillus gyeongsangnamensis TaxID=3388067 RepID=A0ABT4QKI1_9BACL|nr:hypothetical protein [Paenibacillus filicis]MCZ8517389.1 hypothetical protein [Paenibacillus filicis]
MESRSLKESTTKGDLGMGNILSILFILIVGVSWFMNLGWIRIIFMIPMIFHAILFYFSNSSFHRNKNKISNSMKLVNSSVYGTYLLCYILLPDGGDTEDSFTVFFRIIKNEMFINVAAVASEKPCFNNNSNYLYKKR